MKSYFLCTLASVSTLVSAVAIPAPRPDGPGQHGGGQGYGGSSALVAPVVGSKVEAMKSLFSENNKRSRVVYGRYHLLPYNESSLSMGDMSAMAPKPMDMGKGMGGMGGMDMGKGMGGMDMGKGMGGMNMGKPKEQEEGGMENEGGMLDATNKNALKPCSDCTLKYAKAYLKYPDGSVANVNTGAWLHHLTMSVRGPGRSDLRCPGGTMRVPKNEERMLAFHNDRNETYFGLSATDARGYYLGKDDEMVLELMLKNELNVPKDLEFSIEWEYIDGKPEGYGDVRGLWLDIAPCGAMMSDLPPPHGKKQFKFESQETWTSSIDGRLLNTVGHMHDGSTEFHILQNGKNICTSKAVYDDNPEYIPAAEAISKGATLMSHITRYTPCLDIGEIRKGDKFTVAADYDFLEHAPLKNKIGTHSDVMGLAMVFVEVQK
jgi:hypothetical protein